MDDFRRFFQNGGTVKILVWVLIVVIGFLVRVGWTTAKYDSRLIAIEQGDTPVLKAMDSNIRAIAQKVGVPKMELVTPGDFQRK